MRRAAARAWGAFLPEKGMCFGCLFAASLIFLFLRIIWQSSESRIRELKCFLVSEEFAASFFFFQTNKVAKKISSFRDSDMFMIFSRHVPLKRCYDFWRNSWKSVDSAACSFHHLSFNGATFHWLSSWFLFFKRSKGIHVFTSSCWL
jgi:hypothetical protein